jgi:hypothetical protein
LIIIQSFSFFCFNPEYCTYKHFLTKKNYNKPFVIQIVKDKVKEKLTTIIYLIMKARIKEKEKSDPAKGYSYRKRGYYFHADEDFREDWNWGKVKADESTTNHPPGKNTPDSFIS